MIVNYDVYFVKMPLFLHLHARTLEAVHRFYESRRRLFNDDQPSRRNKAEELKKKCKKMRYQKKVIYFLLKLIISLYVPYCTALCQLKKIFED